MNEIPYKLYKVADITQVANSEKVAGAIFFDDATETTHIYGADGTPVIYGSRKWTWSGINYTTFVEEVSVGDSVLWSANELTIVARKNTTAANIVVVTLISNRGFNTIKFIKSSSSNTWSLSSSVVEDFDDFVKKTDIEDLDEIREGASAGSISLPATLDYNEYTFTEKVTPEVKNGSATIRSIKGNTVVWNKMGGLQYGSIGYSTNNPSVFDQNITTKLKVGHKYLALSNIEKGSIIRLFGRIAGSNVEIKGLTEKVTFFESEYDLVGQSNQNLRPDGALWLYYATNDDNIVTQFDIHDLTAMFGAGNEPTTIEEFYARKPIGIDESAYNEGEIVSFNADSLEVRGVNMVDPALLVDGTIKSNGEINETSNYQNILLDVQPNTSYFIYHCASGNDTYKGAFYTEEGLFISLVSGAVVTGQYYQNVRVTTPENCYKMRIVRDVRASEPLSVYLSKELFDGNSFPYFRNIVDLSGIQSHFNGNGLQGCNGVYDTVFFENGSYKVVKSFGKVKMDTLVVNYRSSAGVFIASRTSLGAKPFAKSKCSGYNFVEKNQSELLDGEFTTSGEGYGFQFKDSSLGGDINAFQAKIADMYLVYELDAPGEYEISFPELLSIKAEEGGVERVITTKASTPITAEIAYNYDARSNIESLKQAVENKADKATTLKGYGIIEDYYTDAEVDILLEEVREDVEKEYLPVKGGTITGSLTTRSIVPYAAQAYNLGSSSLPYNIIYSRKSTARELHSNATANGTNSLATMYGCFSGRVSDDETYPYVSLYPFQTKPIQINGVTVYGIELAPSSSATYTYNGVEHTVVNPDTGRYAMVVIIEDALFIGKTNTLNKAFCYSNRGEYWNYESYLLKISDIESAKELIIRGYTSSIPFNTSLAFNIIAFKKSNSSNDKGDYSLSMGQNSNSLKNFALTLGRSTAAAGIGAIALGNQSIAYGLYSIALGFMSAAINSYSLALGYRSIAAHDYSIVMAGYGRSGTAYQTSVGYCNEGKSNTIFEVGYGVATARKNIFEVTTSGNVTSTGTNTATKHITSGGTSAQFVKGDGSLDSTSYATSDENYMLNIGAATGTIQSAVFDKVKAAKTVSINYNSGQYVITITSREKSGSNYRYSAMFPAMDSTFKMFMIDFTVSNSSNAVSYTVTLANLAIGAATVSEEV